jgi:hypothetical protein
VPLFVVEHHHLPRECPASAGRGSGLLSEISAAKAARHGVTIAAEALIDGEHRLILIVEAADSEAVGRFLGFLVQCGELRVMAASTAEAAVARRGCDPAPELIRRERSQPKEP